LEWPRFGGQIDLTNVPQAAHMRSRHFALSCNGFAADLHCVCNGSATDRPPTSSGAGVTKVAIYGLSALQTEKPVEDRHPVMCANRKSPAIRHIQPSQAAGKDRTQGPDSISGRPVRVGLGIRFFGCLQRICNSRTASIPGIAPTQSGRMPSLRCVRSLQT
jgi:hypothetical protein